jgi:hypothetical protein
MLGIPLGYYDKCFIMGISSKYLLGEPVVVILNSVVSFLQSISRYRGAVFPATTVNSIHVSLGWTILTVLNHSWNLLGGDDGILGDNFA